MSHSENSASDKDQPSNLDLDEFTHQEVDSGKRRLLLGLVGASGVLLTAGATVLRQRVSQSGMLPPGGEKGEVLNYVSCSSHSCGTGGPAMVNGNDCGGDSFSGCWSEICAGIHTCTDIHACVTNKCVGQIFACNKFYCGTPSGGSYSGSEDSGGPWEGPIWPGQGGFASWIDEALTASGPSELG